MVRAAVDSRVPDLIGVVQYGVVYTGKQGKIAEHGGANPAGPRRAARRLRRRRSQQDRSVRRRVETTQIAPTILGLLGLDPGALQAVRIEHTRVLPLR